MYRPIFRITASLAKTLMQIAASRQAIHDLSLNGDALANLRHSACLDTISYSAQMEGSRLTLEQVAGVLGGEELPASRPNDVQQVRNLAQALAYLANVTHLASDNIQEPDIQALHGLAIAGREGQSPYRDGQNIVRDRTTGDIVYTPPKAKDVPMLMRELVAWINQEIAAKTLPEPIIGAIAHHELLMIHPYFEGNGQTGRLLSYMCLHNAGFGLSGLYCLEEYYARSQQAYYQALSLRVAQKYTVGGGQADITGWIEYCCAGVAEALRATLTLTRSAASAEPIRQASLLRELDARQRQVLKLFTESRYISTKEIADLLGIHRRTALNLCHNWVEAEFVIERGASNKTRKYELADKWLGLLKQTEWWKA